MMTTPVTAGTRTIGTTGITGPTLASRTLAQGLGNSSQNLISKRFQCGHNVRGPSNSSRRWNSGP